MLQTEFMSLQKKILLVSILPLILAVLGIGALIFNQSNQLSRQQTASFEQGLINAKKAELQYYAAFARNSISNIYHSAKPNDKQAMESVKKIINNLSYGPDGYFFIYDYKGKNLAHPRQAFRIGKNWIDLKDRQGNFVIRDLITAAKRGGGYTNYVWEKPSSKKLERKIGYAIGLDKWGWMVGTGMYIDDVTAQVVGLQGDITKKTTQTFLLILIIVIACLAIVGGGGVLLALQQHKASQGQLKALNQQIVETQENERTRVARELHDGISQQLSSTKYVFELAQIQHSKNNTQTGKTISRGIIALAGAISEVRRISKDLRPGMLDDLGLAPALNALADEFNTRTGLKVIANTVPVRSLLSDEAKTALFRIAQEALNNIARHAGASEVNILLSTSSKFITLKISDNGTGFKNKNAKTSTKINGMGLTNMTERIAHYDGKMNISTSEKGTVITANIPIVKTGKHIQIAAE